MRCPAAFVRRISTPALPALETSAVCNAEQLKLLLNTDLLWVGPRGVGQPHGLLTSKDFVVTTCNDLLTPFLSSMSRS